MSSPIVPCEAPLLEKKTKPLVEKDFTFSISQLGNLNQTRKKKSVRTIETAQTKDDTDGHRPSYDRYR